MNLPDPPQVAILVGGRGTRLRPLTDRLPKFLAPVHGRPFLAYLLADLRRQGTREVVLCSGYRAESVIGAVGDGSAFGLTVLHSVEDSPLQPIGALRHALHALDESFVLLYGDVYPRVPLAALVGRARAAPEPAVMVVVRDRDGNSRVEDGLVTAYAKGVSREDLGWLDAGLLALTRDLLLEDDAGDEQAFYGRLAQDGRLAALTLERDRRPYEIGSLDGYRRFAAAAATPAERVP